VTPEVGGGEAGGGEAGGADEVAELKARLQSLEERVNELSRANGEIRKESNQNAQKLAEISASLSQVRDVWAGDVAELKTASKALASALPESAEDARQRQREIEAALARYSN